MKEMNLIMLKSAKSEVILPADIVRQILPYAPLMLTTGTLDRVMGSLIVQNEKLPVIQLLGEVMNDNALLVGQGAKLIWIRSVGKKTKMSGYILIADEQPRIVNCKSEQIVNEVPSEIPYMAYQAELKLSDKEVHKVFVPDLIQLEQDLEKG